jgi:serine phosphatase RsbU (regulator of sigma subunit)
MADWDKAAEQIGEMAEHFRQIFAKIDRIEASQQRCIEIADRMLGGLMPGASAPTEGYPAPALLDRLDGIERRLTRLQRDQTQAEIGQIERGTRVLQLDGHLRELEQRLRKIEQRLDALEQGRREDGP